MTDVYIQYMYLISGLDKYLVPGMMYIRICMARIYLVVVYVQLAEWHEQTLNMRESCPISINK